MFFTEFSTFSGKKFGTLKELKPASCIKDQHATTAPARHM